VSSSPNEDNTVDTDTQQQVFPKICQRLIEDPEDRVVDWQAFQNAKRNENPGIS
jgi:hypothetical protein